MYKSVLALEFSEIFEDLKEVPQRKDYHPEIWVWDHEAYVYFNILKNCENFSGTKKRELLLTALFHDIGKIDTTFYREKKECYVAYGHENASLSYYDSIKDLVVPPELRKDVIRFLIEQHMKPKFMDNMNEDTIEAIKDEAKELGDDVWDMLISFSKFDDMNSFFKNSDEEERLEAKYRFHSYCKKLTAEIDSYYREREEDGELFLVRGVPGSGKTTVASIIENLSDKVYKVAADDFFVNEDDGYNFDGSKLGDAHRFCRNKTSEAMENGYELIIVHNTFVQRWEMLNYFRLALEKNYRVHTLITENRHKSGSIHDISESKIEEKKEDFELKL